MSDKTCQWQNSHLIKKRLNEEIIFVVALLPTLIKTKQKSLRFSDNIDTLPWEHASLNDSQRALARWIDWVLISYHQHAVKRAEDSRQLTLVAVWILLNWTYRWSRFTHTMYGAWAVYTQPHKKHNDIDAWAGQNRVKCLFPRSLIHWPRSWQSGRTDYQSGRNNGNSSDVPGCSALDKKTTSK